MQPHRRRDACYPEGGKRDPKRNELWNQDTGNLSRRGLIASAPILGAALLAGCGFSPMYARDSSAVAVLASIAVEPIEERIGQILRNELIDRLTPRGEPPSPRYRLLVTISRSRAALAIQSDTSITRYNLRLSVTFRLLDATTGDELYRDTTVAIGGYNAVQSDFATLVAEQDSTRRAARKAGEDIHTLLRVYFSREHAFI